MRCCSNNLYSRTNFDNAYIENIMQTNAEVAGVSISNDTTCTTLCQHACADVQTSTCVSFPQVSNPNTGLANDLCGRLNERVVFTVGGSKVNVIICAVTPTLVRAIEYNTGKVLYINLNRIDNVEEILSFR